MQAKLTAFGTLNALRYKGTEQDGSDVYDAEFAKGRAKFRLIFQEDGKIAGASFDQVPQASVISGDSRLVMRTVAQATRCEGKQGLSLYVPKQKIHFLRVRIDIPILPSWRDKADRLRNFQSLRRAQDRW